MLNNIRNFSKTIFAKILLVIIIIPFVFWGMGGVFNRGNTNSLAKINNKNISTQDFIEHLNISKIDSNKIKENIDNDILEELLGELISRTLIEMEIVELNLSISEKSLVEQIKKNKNFIDDNKKFSRTKYEKFLLSNNMVAPDFEARLLANELQKKLFSYIGGGIKSPFFLTNSVFKDQNSKIEINYINLEDKYINKEDFTEFEIKTFIEENKESLKKEFIDFSFIKINPKNLIGTDEYNKLFFEKIDAIENKILNGNEYQVLVSELKIESIKKNDFIIDKESSDIEKKIYKKRNENKIQLIEANDSYILYEIINIKKILPSLNNVAFKDRIKKILYEKNKFEYNKKIFNEINEKTFNQISFNMIGNNKDQNIKLKSIKDYNKFNMDSVKLLYSLPKNSYSLISDENGDIYLAKIADKYTSDISIKSNEFEKFNKQANIKLRNSMFSSYDYMLNNKYKVKINKKTLEKVKNYFR